MAEDEGWGGSWEPHIVDEDTLKKLRDLAGQPVTGRGGRYLSKIQVDLMSGETQYPAPGGYGGGRGRF